MDHIPRRPIADYGSDGYGHQQAESAIVLPPADDDTEPTGITDDKQRADRIAALDQTDAFGKLRGFA